MFCDEITLAHILPFIPNRNSLNIEDPIQINRIKILIKILSENAEYSCITHLPTY